MDTYTLKVNDENIRKTFEEDALGRNEYVLGLVKWINQVDKNAVFSLEGDWGSGKTFLLKQLELVYNDSSVLNEWKNKPNNINLSDFKFDDAKIFYYDAWENDGAENPLLNLVYNLAVSFNILTKKIEVKTNAEEIAKFAWGKIKHLNPAFEVVDFIKQFVKIESKDIFESVSKENVVEDTIKGFINEIKLKCDGKKIVIAIDELDRCRPEFALRIIESIKHYFDEDGIIVILSMNIIEMQSIIKKYYGNDIDANTYLDKIIDVHLQVPKLEVKDYIKYVLGKVNNNALVYYAMMTVINKYHLNMRQINRYLGELKAILKEDVLCGFTVPGGLYEDVTSLYVIKLFLPIYLIGIYNVDSKIYNDLISGNAKDTFLNDFLSDKNNISYFRVTSLANCTDKHEMSDENVEKCKVWLSEMYDKCFNNDATQNNTENYIYIENKKFLFNTLNLISITSKFHY